METNENETVSFLTECFKSDTRSTMINKFPSEKEWAQ